MTNKKLGPDSLNRVSTVSDIIVLESYVMTECQRIILCTQVSNFPIHWYALCVCKWSECWIVGRWTWGKRLSGNGGAAVRLSRELIHAVSQPQFEIVETARNFNWKFDQNDSRIIHFKWFEYYMSAPRTFRTSWLRHCHFSLKRWRPINCDPNQSYSSGDTRWETAELKNEKRVPTDEGTSSWKSSPKPKFIFRLDCLYSTNRIPSRIIFHTRFHRVREPHRRNCDKNSP